MAVVLLSISFIAIFSAITYRTSNFVIMTGLITTFWGKKCLMSVVGNETPKFLKIQMKFRPGETRVNGRHRDTAGNIERTVIWWNGSWQHVTSGCPVTPSQSSWLISCKSSIMFNKGPPKWPNAQWAKCDFVWGKPIVHVLGCCGKPEEMNPRRCMLQAERSWNFFSGLQGLVTDYSKTMWGK